MTCCRPAGREHRVLVDSWRCFVVILICLGHVTGPVVWAGPDDAASSTLVGAAWAW